MRLTSIRLLIIVNLIITTQINAFSTNWYISNSGDDNNSGNDQENPIATIEELNTKTLQPGDSVLFERGGVWRLATDDALEVNQSGTLGNHIVYTAYGEGDKPRLLGSNQIIGWTNAGGNIWQATLNYNPRQTGYGAELFCEDGENVYWTLNVNGDGGYAGMTEDLDWYYESNTVYLYSTEDPDTRFTSVEAPRTERHIYLNNNEYITIDNLEICYTTNVGIYDAYGSANIKGLRITNCHIHHIGHKDSGQAFGASLKHSDMYIGYNDIHDCGRRNISLVTYGTSPSMNISNILIENNYLHHGWHTTGVDINTTGDHYYDSIVIRNNYFYDPIDDDITDEPPNKSLTSNHIFCADQGGGSFTGIYIYNNIFHGHKGNGVLMEGVDEVNVYYNTFYGFNTTLTGYATFVTVVNCQDIDIRNNVFHNNGDPATERDLYVASINDSSSYLRTIMDYNLWYKEIQNSRVFMLQNVGGRQTYYYYDLTEWELFKNTIGYEMNSPAPSNPNFMDVEGRNFNLLEGSPAIGKATPIPIVTTDYFGNTRNPAAPTIGAIEYGNYLNTEADIESFEILEQIGESTIDAEQRTVSVLMPFGLSLGNLSPGITVSTGATISPESGVIQDFNSPVEYAVTAEDGTTIQTWEITVTNAVLSEETDIVTFSIPGQVGQTTVNTSLHTVQVTMPYGNSLSNLSPTLVLSYGATIDPASGASQDFTSPVTYTVTAEDGTTTQDWIVNVVNGPSDEAGILTLSIAGQLGQASINTNNHTIQVTMPYGVSLSDLSPTMTLSSGAASLPASGISQDFTSPVTYTVTAEDGTTTQDWTVSVVNEPSDETDILTFTLPGQVGQTTINNNEHTVEVTMAYGVSLSNLSPSLTLSEGATSEPTSGVNQNFSSPVIYTVMAEDGTTTQNWAVTVVNAPSNETDILSFSVPGQEGQATISNENHTIQITMPYGMTFSNLVPTLSLSSGATSNPASQTSQNFLSPVTYTVTAEDGTTTRDWIVNVVNAPSNETEILTFSVAGQVGQSIINNTEHTVQVTMPYGVSLSNLAPALSISSGATSNPASGTTHNFLSHVVYTVTAEDGFTTQDWTVNIVNTPSNETNILAFSVAGQVGQSIINDSEHTIQVTMPYGMDLSNLAPALSLSPGASSNPASGTTHDFSSTVTYTLTAEDGSSTQDWTVTVVNESSNETNIVSFMIPGQEGQTFVDINEHTALLTMPRGTDLSNLTPVITLSSGATSNPVSGVSQDFTSPVTYTVTAADGITTQNWTITVMNAYSDETDILSFSIQDQVGQSIINATEHTVQVIMPSETDLSNLSPVITLSSGASVDPASGIVQNYTSPVTYNVTAEDGSTTQGWTISVVNAFSQEADILSFSIQGQVGQSVINLTEHTVQVIMPGGTDLSNLLPSITISAGASINPISGLSQDFSSAMVYTVTSEDGVITRDWTVTVISAFSTEAEILSFSIPGQVGETVIDAVNHIVTLIMPAGTSLSSLIPSIIISDGAIILPESETEQDFNSSVLYKIQAQDEQTEQDWIVFVKNESDLNVVHDDSIMERMVFDIGINNLNKSFSPINIEWEIPTELDASSLYEEDIKILPKQYGEFTLILKIDDGNETTEKYIDILVEPLNPNAQQLDINSVTASSYSDYNFPFSSVDNNLDTKWLTVGSSESIVYELDEASYLSHVEIAFFDGDKNRTNFEIQASSDNQTWEQLYDNGISCGFSNAFEAFDLMSEITLNNPYKFIKVIGHADNETVSNLGSIAEFKVFGSITTETNSNLLGEKLNFEVYPNPSTDYLHVSVEKLGDVKIIDSQGRTLYDIQDVEGTITINHNLIKGVYFLQYIHNNTVTTRKIVVK